MSSFRIKSSSIKNVENCLQEIKTDLNRFEGTIIIIRNNIPFETGSSRSIQNRLNSQQIKINDLANKVNKTRSVLDIILQKYISYEQNLAEAEEHLVKDPEKPITENARYDGQGSKTNIKDDDSERDVRYKDYMDFLKHISNGSSIFKTIMEQNGQTGMEKWGFGNSAASLMLSIASMFDPEADRSKLGVFKQFLSLEKNELGVAGKVIEWIDKKIGKSSESVIKGLLYDNNPVKTTAFMGILTGGISAISALTSASGKTVSDQLHDSWKLAGAGGKLATSIDKVVNAANYMNLSDAEKLINKTKTTNTLAGVTGAISMAADFTATVYDRYTDDNRFDVEDVGFTCLHTGATGFASLVSTYTAGAVNLDVDRSVMIYNAYAKKGAEIISSTNLPVPVQVALSVPGTVVAGALGTVSTVIDYGMQIGEGIKKLFHW